MSKELIRLRDLCMAFDDELVLDHINLYINNSEFLTLLGPSGCGKTTTLRIIGGFTTPTSGDVTFDGVRINDVPPHKRQINTVFQKYALFPHLDVFENIAFGLRLAKVPAALLGEVQQPGAERVFPVFAVLREHAHELQTLDDAVDGADGHVHHGRDIRDAKLLPVVLKAVEDVKGLQKRRHIEILIHNEGRPLLDASILAQFFSKFKTLNAQFFSEKVT